MGRVNLDVGPIHVPLCLAFHLDKKAVLGLFVTAALRFDSQPQINL